MSATAVSKQELRHLPVSGSAALGSRLVSRLTGLTTSQLQYWHASHLQRAHLRAGARGKPRRYTWVDYQRLRLIAKLMRKGIPTARIRQAVEWLDQNVPDWHIGELDVSSLPRSRAFPRARVEFVHGNRSVLADGSGQIDLGAALRDAVSEWNDESPLGCLARFADAITMDPLTNAGLPTLRGTTLEAGFLARLSRVGSIREVADLYRIDEQRLRRVIEFEEAAA